MIRARGVIVIKITVHKRPLNSTYIVYYYNYSYVFIMFSCSKIKKSSISFFKVIMRAQISGL